MRLNLLRSVAILGLVLLVFGTASFADDAALRQLRFDGVYQAHPGGGAQSLYLRFYSDNLVVAMSYAGPPGDVAEFIDRSHAGLPQGKYAFNGGEVIFTTKATRGEIDYKGRFAGDGMIFHIHSRITDFAADEHFEFHKVAFPKSADSGSSAAK